MARVLNNIQIAGFVDSNPDSIKYGTSTVHQVYKGSTLIWTRPIFLTLAAGKNCTTSWSLTYPDDTTEIITTPQTIVVGYGTKVMTTSTANSGYYFNDDQTQTTWTDSDTVTSPYTDYGGSAYKVKTMSFTINLVENGKWANSDNTTITFDGYTQYQKIDGIVNENTIPFSSLEVDVYSKYAWYDDTYFSDLTFHTTFTKEYDFIDISGSSCEAIYSTAGIKSSSDYEQFKITDFLVDEWQAHGSAYSIGDINYTDFTFEAGCRYLYAGKFSDPNDYTIEENGYMRIYYAGEEGGLITTLKIKIDEVKYRDYT